MSEHEKNKRAIDRGQLNGGPFFLRTRIKRIRDELWAQLDAPPLDGAEGEDKIQAGAIASA